MSELGTDVGWAVPTPAEKRQLQAENGAADSTRLSLGVFGLGIGEGGKKKRGLQTELLRTATPRADLLIQASLCSLQTYVEMFKGSI